MLTREQLPDRLGWSGRLRYRHPHQFPVPAVYTTNEAARIELESRLSALSGGYVALVGPAGSGKSTLLASLNVSGPVARYYAFVPDAPDPLSGRGEADSFLHDLSLALEDSGLHRHGVGNDMRSQRSVLQDQLDRAGRRWAERGERTVIVVDGLDHIPREQNPTRSLIEELPSPASLPEGVFVILGSQTVTVLPPSLRAALQQQDRTVTLPPLSTDDEQLDDLIETKLKLLVTGNLRAARRVLLHYADEIIHREVTADDIWDFLHDNGVEQHTRGHGPLGQRGKPGSSAARGTSRPVAPRYTRAAQPGDGY